MRAYHLSAAASRVVEAVGAGVDHVAVGDAVVGHVQLAPPIPQETLAEYALLPAAGGTVLAGPVREVVGPLAEQAADGRLAVDVSTVLPLDRAAEGLATIADGQARGKIVIKVAD